MPAPSASPAAPANLPAEPKEVRAIRLANGPSEAVQAYAEAIKVNDKNPAVYDMYIRRMMGFRLFEILGAPAQELVKLDPNNGLGWAVLGFTLARQGNMPAAFDDAVKAVNASPKDPFVLGFAGQLAGWYSHQAGQEGLPPTILQAVLKLREFAAQPAYVQGYTAASDAILPPAQAAPPVAAATTTQTPQATIATPDVSATYSSDPTQSVPPADTGNYYSYTDAPVYYSSNYADTGMNGYPGYDAGYYMPYASPYYGGYYGGFGFGSGFLVGSPLFFGHRFFDGDHDADDFRGRGAFARNNLFFNSSARSSLAHRRALAGTAGMAAVTNSAAVRSAAANRAGVTGAGGATGAVTAARFNSAATVGRSVGTPAFSTSARTAGRWSTMSPNVGAARTQFRASSVGTAAPRATFSAPAASFRGSAVRSSGSFGGSGVSHFSSSGASHFSSGAAHFSGGGGGGFRGGGGGGGHGGGGRR
jgi:hypothetical protein